MINCLIGSTAMNWHPVLHADNDFEVLARHTTLQIGLTAAVDPNHLVSLGTSGGGECGLAVGDYQYVHAGSIDLCEYHEHYNVAQAMPNDGYNRLAQRISQCQSLNKPLVVGESGISADVGKDGQSTGSITSGTLQNRARFFHAKITA